MSESDSSGRRNHSESGSGLRYSQCDSALWGEALETLYHRMTRTVRRRVIADVLAQADLGLLDLDGLWIAQRGFRVVGAILTQALAGRVAAIWAPEVVLSPEAERAEVARRLVRIVLEDYRGHDFMIAQALIGPDAAPQAGDDLAGGGLPRVTELSYLHRPTATPMPVDAPAAPLDWRGFGPETEPLFRAILPRTYLGSLDMPELEGLRRFDDVLDGHRASGRFRPDLWRIGIQDEAAATGAVVLLSPQESLDIKRPPSWEISYLGLTPELRGRGYGRATLVHAMELAGSRVERLELAVDARNIPAAKLYRHCGFVTFDRRQVHLTRL